MFLADKHNFGQQVEKVQRGSDTWYRKPRTVYWEWLFFGKTSPLKQFFSKCGKNGIRPLADYFFNLDAEVENNWLGYSKQILGRTITPIDEHFYAFGALLSYCYIFGIRDLHKQNLIMTETHLQAVDIEVVFTNLTLPHETLLLPFKGIGYEFAGIGALVASKDELTDEQKKHIVFGYWDLFNVVIDNRNEIFETLKKLDFSAVPARVIIRNTSEYKNLLQDQPPNVLKSEIAQLERGDVPFYFKFCGDPTLYWLREKDTPEAETSLETFKRDVDRHANFNEGFLTKTRDEYLAQGLLYCLKHLDVNFDIALSKKTKVRPRSLEIGNLSFSR